MGRRKEKSVSVKGKKAVLEGYAGGVFQYIRAKSKDLPQKQQLVCDYILNNYQKAAFLSAEELARESGTSHATVFRAVASLGFASYIALRDKLQEVLTKTSIPPLDRLKDTFAEADENNILDMVIEENIRNLRSMNTPDLRVHFPRAVELLVSARRIYIVGLRSTKGIALYLHALLQQFWRDVFLVDATGSDTILDVMLDMGKEDALIALMAGSPHYTKRTITCVKYAHDNNIPVVLITNSLSSAAAPLATELLLAPQNTPHYSSSSLLTICDALVAALGTKKPQEANEKIDKLSTLLVKYDISL
ncbi:MurR/RpiR family transcriptional regulator [Thermovirga sp.]|uniref:MurR/RpiR family transcriptional regulator n=1 Tax=Thermovirga sp. TaxID=2699834 RepID=UPI0025FEC2B2|nr:MurR/RpiR family transcriptional regulator [Thermovirga sp.]MBO8153795.1 MurR/RpiR family transcriptional regulator [Thermovirga sp.]